MNRHLPVLAADGRLMLQIKLEAITTQLIEDHIELFAGVIHRGGDSGLDAGCPHNRCIEIGEGERNIAHPGRTISPELDALLRQHLRRHRGFPGPGTVARRGHVIERNAQGAVRQLRKRLECSLL